MFADLLLGGLDLEPAPFHLGEQFGSCYRQAGFDLERGGHTRRGWLQHGHVLGGEETEFARMVLKRVDEGGFREGGVDRALMELQLDAGDAWV